MSQVNEILEDKNQDIRFLLSVIDALAPTKQYRSEYINKRIDRINEDLKEPLPSVDWLSEDNWHSDGSRVYLPIPNTINKRAILAEVDPTEGLTDGDRRYVAARIVYGNRALNLIGDMLRCDYQVIDHERLEERAANLIHAVSANVP